MFIKYPMNHSDIKPELIKNGWQTRRNINLSIEAADLVKRDVIRASIQLHDLIIWNSLQTPLRKTSKLGIWILCQVYVKSGVVKKYSATFQNFPLGSRLSDGKF